MTAASVLEELRAARAGMDRACGLLVAASPEGLAGCSGVLESAHSALAHGRAEWDQLRGDQEALAEAQSLRAAVDRARRLLETAQEYHTRWNQLLGSKMAGYQAGGQAATLIRPSRVFVRG